MSPTILLNRLRRCSVCNTVLIVVGGRLTCCNPQCGGHEGGQR